jgi:tetratricopeptide (TPR) repeat protein
LKLAALLQQQNKAEDSLAVLRAAEEAGAPPSVLQLAWGEALIVAKEPGKAEEIFRKALAGEPTSISARLGIASALEAQGKLAESRASLEDTLKASPETLGLRERLAQVCLKLGDKTEALAHYQDEIQAGHATPALRLAVARIALDLGKLELVQSEARKVLDEDPRNAEATFLTGRMHEERNEVGAALQEYRHATTWDHLPAYGLAYGRLLAKFGKEHEALLAFESATSLADGRMERGRIYYRRGEMEDALADFQAAGKMTPGEAEPLILQGLCYDKMGQSAKAEESWRAALRADPEAPEPHYRLGRMEMDRGKPAGAVDHFRKAEARVPDKATWRAEMYFQLAQAELLTGSKASALAGFKKYLELAPPDAPARPEATHQVARLATSGKK